MLTITRGTLENTDVLLRNGKIAAVGKNLNASANARIIDGTGKFVMPGIIDCHSHSMLDTINEGTLAVTSMVRTARRAEPDRRRSLSRVGRRRHHAESAARLGESDRRAEYGREDQVWPSGEEFLFPGAMPGIKFALGENLKRSSSAESAGRHASLSKHAHGRGRSDSRCVHARA